MARLKNPSFLLAVAWIASIVSTLGSLYLSEVLHFLPCKLCWFQRIFMYPQVLLLGIALYRKEYTMAIYSLVLSIAGACISLYHYGEQKIPFLQQNSGSCGVVSCGNDYLNWFGVITIPLLALIGFVIIAVSSTLLLKAERA
ncbi:disulfide oxidoreductase [Metabacillus sp. GX 13764]|uniref:disulfide oxidoreductase n=1 Tax=Metabacillus kandeliae TaxID=2900151 RepID=UPI001E472CA4|nr:disulfide oxidoreductase [Metabacillus kandeliae]MCD7035193.1 disulfide oxidoreductase [Metabacillus kandeliae]